MSSSQQLLLGEGAGGAAPVYIEDVFKTWLYAGNSSTQTITNGIDLSTKGGLVWSKYRTSSFIHNLFDTTRGVQKTLCSNSTDAEATETQGITAFNSNGYTTGSWSQINSSSGNFVSWTFRKQPKFFDVVTFTAGTNTNRRISHSLDSVPGFWILKSITINGANWDCYHTSLGLNASINLNLDGSAGSGSNRWGTAPTSTTLGINEQAMCSAGYTYILYIFANDAGGFGLTGTDNVISCGSYVGDGTTRLINIGYEPQWILIKNVTSGSGGSANDWKMIDNMRGFTATNNSAVLEANTSDGETNDNPITIASQGFNTNNMRNTSQTYIYIAIRRGPMKVPTAGTSVFTPLYFTGNDSTSRQLTAGFVTDTFLGKRSIGDTSPFVDRLRGKDLQLYTSLTNAEATSSLYCRFDSNTGPIVGYNAAGGININSSAYTYRTYSFGRAPSFHDVVCYTGTDTARTITHNLAAVPELMIVKDRSINRNWFVYVSGVGNTKYLNLNNTDAATTDSGIWNNATPTSSVFSLGSSSSVNGAGENFVAYLFATLAGVSKVGSYTGNGGSQTINCGFTSGARFVLIRKSSGTGNWNLWDSARGIVSGNDPYFALNLSDGEVTSNDSVDTNSTGFVVNEVAATNANESGATYIFLAIA